MLRQREHAIGRGHRASHCYGFSHRGRAVFGGAYKEDSVKVKELLADHIVMPGSSTKQRISGKDSVATAFFKNKTIKDFKATPLTKSGDANMVYYTGFFSQNYLPSAKYKKGGVGTGSYMLIAREDNKNDWKISYLHIAQAPLRQNK